MKLQMSECSANVCNQKFDLVSVTWNTTSPVTGVTLSTTTAFLESTSTSLPAKKSELGITPEKHIIVFDLCQTAQAEFLHYQLCSTS